MVTEIRLTKGDGIWAERRLHFQQLGLAGHAVDDEWWPEVAPLFWGEVRAALENQVRHGVRRLNKALRPGQVATHEDVETYLCVGAREHHSHI